MPANPQVTDEMCLAAAQSDGEFDGRGWMAMPRAERERYLERSRAALTTALADHVVVPREPTRGLLISMALRMDHAFGAPEQEPIPGMKLGHTDSYREVVLRDLAKAYEEVVGDGFYAPEREEYYRAMISAAPLPKEG